MRKIGPQISAKLAPYVAIDIEAAALDALFSHGRPRRVQLCVLIDRGHREIPVEASFVGRNVQTTTNEVIEVKLTEIDDAEKVLLMER